MATQNGVIDTASGDLKRAAFKPYDFANDGGFDSATETIRTDVPIPGKRKGNTDFPTHHRWTGSAYIEVAQMPVVFETPDPVSNMFLGCWNPAANLVAHFLLDDAASDTTVLDSSAHSRDGTLEGGDNTEDKSISGLTKDSMAFDMNGIDDTVNIDAVATALASTTKGTWACVIEPDDVTLNNDMMIAFGDTDGNEFINLQQSPTDGKIQVKCRKAGTTQWAFTTDAVVIANGTKTWLAVVHDGTAPKLYVDGVAVAITFTDSTDKTAWFSALTGLDNGRIAGDNRDSAGNGRFWNGTIDDVRFYDIDISVLDHLGIYNQGKGTHLEAGTVLLTAAQLSDLLP